MANLFDKLSGTLSNLADDKLSDTSNDSDKNSNKSFADNDGNSGNSHFNIDRTPFNIQDGANVRKTMSQGKTKVEMHGSSKHDTQFVIPKKSVQKSGLLVNLMKNSREFQHEILPAITKNYRSASSSNRFSYVKVQSVHNKELMNQYLDKRKDLRKNGYTEKEVGDSMAFLCTESEEEVHRICQEGLSVGNFPESVLGDPDMGVQLCRHSDIIRSSPLPPVFTGYLILFKVIKGRVKLVAENNSGNHLEPTPNFDSHMTNDSQNDETLKHEALFLATQLYVYEYGENSHPVRHPRNICPIAVVQFMYDIEKTKDNRGVHFTGTRYPIGTPYGFAGNWHDSNDDQEYVVWTGNLTVKGLYACLVDMKSVGSWIKPAKIGHHINITHKMDANQARKKYLNNVCSLHRKVEGHWNGTYVNVCELHPGEPESKSHFQRIMNYLGKHNAVAIVKVDKDVILLLLTASELSYQLGLSKPHQYPVLLYCLFLSKKSVKHRFEVPERTAQKKRDPSKHLNIVVPTPVDRSQQGGFSPSKSSASQSNRYSVPNRPIAWPHHGGDMQSISSTVVQRTPENPTPPMAHSGRTSLSLTVPPHWNQPPPNVFHSQIPSPGKQWISPQPPHSNIPLSSLQSSLYLPPSPSHFPNPFPAHLPPSPVHHSRPPVSPSTHLSKYSQSCSNFSSPSSDHSAMLSPNFVHHPPNFQTSYSSPSKLPMGPPSTPSSPQVTPSSSLSHSPRQMDPRSSPYEASRTPPTDPRVHGLHRSPSTSQYLGPKDVTPPGMKSESGSRSPFLPRKNEKYPTSPYALPSSSPRNASVSSSSSMVSPKPEWKRTSSTTSTVNYDEGYRHTPTVSSLLTIEKVKKEFHSQCEIQAVKQHLKSKLVKVDVEKESNSEMTDSDMEIIKEGHKRKGGPVEESREPERKPKPEKRKLAHVSPALGKEANEMKEFLDSGLEKKKHSKSHEKKMKPIVQDKKKVETPPLVDKIKPIEAVKVKVPELKLDSLEDIANIRKKVDMEIQKGNERIPKLEEERNRLKAEFERKKKLKMEKRKKRPSGLTSEEPKGKIARKEGILVENKLGDLSPHVDSASDMKSLLNKDTGHKSKSSSKTRESVSEMKKFLNTEMVNSQLILDNASVLDKRKDDKQTEKKIEKVRPYFDLAEDISTSSRMKKGMVSEDLDSYKGKKKMTVHPMVDNSKKASDKINEEEEATGSKSSRWDRITKKIKDRRGTGGSSDGEGERKVEKINGGKIIIIKEIRMKYVNKHGKEDNSDSDTSTSSMSDTRVKRSNSGKRKHHSDHGNKRGETSVKGLVKYSDSDSCSEKSFNSQEKYSGSSRVREEHPSDVGPSKDGEKRRRLIDESGDHSRRRDHDKDEYRHRTSRDGRSLGPRVVMGLQSSDREKNHGKADEKSISCPKRKVKSWVHANKVKSKSKVTISGIVTKDEISFLAKIPKIPKKKNVLGSKATRSCPHCSMSCCKCESEKLLVANSKGESLSCDIGSINQKLPHVNTQVSLLDHGKDNEGNNSDTFFDKKNCSAEFDEKPRNGSVEAGSKVSKRRNSRNSVDFIMNSVMKNVRKSKKKIVANACLRKSSADVLLEAEPLDLPVPYVAEELDDDVFTDSIPDIKNKDFVLNTADKNDISDTDLKSSTLNNTKSSESNSAGKSGLCYEKFNNNKFHEKFTIGKYSFQTDSKNLNASHSLTGKERIHTVFSVHPDLDANIVHGALTDLEIVDPVFVPDPCRAVELAGKSDKELRITVANDADVKSMYKWISLEQLIMQSLHGPIDCTLSKEERELNSLVQMIIHTGNKNICYERLINEDTESSIKGVESSDDRIKIQNWENEVCNLPSEYGTDFKSDKSKVISQESNISKYSVVRDTNKDSTAEKEDADNISRSFVEDASRACHKDVRVTYNEDIIAVESERQVCPGKTILGVNSAPEVSQSQDQDLSQKEDWREKEGNLLECSVKKRRQSDNLVTLEPSVNESDYIFESNFLEIPDKGDYSRIGYGNRDIVEIPGLTLIVTSPRKSIIRDTMKNVKISEHDVLSNSDKGDGVRNTIEHPCEKGDNLRAPELDLLCLCEKGDDWKNTIVYPCEKGDNLKIPGVTLITSSRETESSGTIQDLKIPTLDYKTKNSEIIVNSGNGVNFSRKIDEERNNTPMKDLLKLSEDEIFNVDQSVSETKPCAESRLQLPGDIMEEDSSQISLSSSQEKFENDIEKQLQMIKEGLDDLQTISDDVDCSVQETDVIAREVNSTNDSHNAEATSNEGNFADSLENTEVIQIEDSFMYADDSGKSLLSGRQDQEDEVPLDLLDVEVDNLEMAEFHLEELKFEVTSESDVTTETEGFGKRRVLISPETLEEIGDSDANLCDTPSTDTSCGTKMIKASDEEEKTHQELPSTDLRHLLKNKRMSNVSVEERGNTEQSVQCNKEQTDQMITAEKMKNIAENDESNIAKKKQKSKKAISPIRGPDSNNLKKSISTVNRSSAKSLVKKQNFETEKVLKVILPKFDVLENKFEKKNSSTASNGNDKNVLTVSNDPLNVPKEPQKIPNSLINAPKEPQVVPIEPPNVPKFPLNVPKQTPNLPKFPMNVPLESNVSKTALHGTSYNAKCKSEHTILSQQDIAVENKWKKITTGAETSKTEETVATTLQQQDSTRNMKLSVSMNSVIKPLQETSKISVGGREPLSNSATQQMQSTVVTAHGITSSFPPALCIKGFSDLWQSKALTVGESKKANQEKGSTLAVGRSKEANQGKGSALAIGESKEANQGKGSTLAVCESKEVNQGKGSALAVGESKEVNQGKGSTLAVGKSKEGNQGKGSTLAVDESKEGNQGKGSTLAVGKSKEGNQGKGSTLAVGEWKEGTQEKRSTLAVGKSKEINQGKGSTLVVPESNKVVHESKTAFQDKVSILAVRESKTAVQESDTVQEKGSTFTLGESSKTVQEPIKTHRGKGCKLAVRESKTTVQEPVKIPQVKGCTLAERESKTTVQKSETPQEKEYTLAIRESETTVQESKTPQETGSTSAVRESKTTAKELKTSQEKTSTTAVRELKTTAQESETPQEKGSTIAVMELKKTEQDLKKAVQRKTSIVVVRESEKTVQKSKKIIQDKESILGVRESKKSVQEVQKNVQEKESTLMVRESNKNVQESKKSGQEKGSTLVVGESSTTIQEWKKAAQVQGFAKQSNMHLKACSITDKKTDTSETKSKSKSKISNNTQLSTVMTTESDRINLPNKIILAEKSKELCAVKEIEDKLKTKKESIGDKQMSALQELPIRKEKMPQGTSKEADKETKSGPTRTSSRAARQGRQFHPYKKEEKRKKKNSWSFDVAYNSLRELMQDLTTESYRQQHQGQKILPIRYCTPPRFANYKFKRSEVPIALPDSEEEDNEDFTEDAIPDFEERKRKADLIEKMMEGSVEDEDYNTEQNIYTKEDIQTRNSKEQKQDSPKESVQSRLIKLASNTQSTERKTRPVASATDDSWREDVIYPSTLPMASKDDSNNNPDLRFVINKLKSEQEKNVSSDQEFENRKIKMKNIATSKINMQSSMHLTNRLSVSTDSRELKTSQSSLSPSLLLEANTRMKTAGKDENSMNEFCRYSRAESFAEDSNSSMEVFRCEETSDLRNRFDSLQNRRLSSSEQLANMLWHSSNEVLAPALVEKEVKKVDYVLQPLELNTDQRNVYKAGENMLDCLISVEIFGEDPRILSEKDVLKKGVLISDKVNGKMSNVCRSKAVVKKPVEDRNYLKSFKSCKSENKSRLKENKEIESNLFSNCKIDSLTQSKRESRMELSESESEKDNSKGSFHGDWVVVDEVQSGTSDLEYHDYDEFSRKDNMKTDLIAKRVGNRNNQEKSKGLPVGCCGITCTEGKDGDSEQLMECKKWEESASEKKHNKSSQDITKNVCSRLSDQNQQVTAIDINKETDVMLVNDVESVEEGKSSGMHKGDRLSRPPKKHMLNSLRDIGEKSLMSIYKNEEEDSNDFVDSEFHVEAKDTSSDALYNRIDTMKQREDEEIRNTVLSCVTLGLASCNIIVSEVLCDNDKIGETDSKKLEIGEVKNKVNEDDQNKDIVCENESESKCEGMPNNRKQKSEIPLVPVDGQNKEIMNKMNEKSEVVSEESGRDQNKETLNKQERKLGVSEAPSKNHGEKTLNKKEEELQMVLEVPNKETLNKEEEKLEVVFKNLEILRHGDKHLSNMEDHSQVLWTKNDVLKKDVDKENVYIERGTLCSEMVVGDGSDFYGHIQVEGSEIVVTNNESMYEGIRNPAGKTLDGIRYQGHGMPDFQCVLEEKRKENSPLRHSQTLFVENASSEMKESRTKEFARMDDTETGNTASCAMLFSNSNYSECNSASSDSEQILDDSVSQKPVDLSIKGVNEVSLENESLVRYSKETVQTSETEAYVEIIGTGSAAVDVNHQAILTINADSTLNVEDHNFQEIIFATDQQLEDIISVFAIEDSNTTSVDTAGDQYNQVQSCDLCSDGLCQSKFSCNQELQKSEDPLEEAMFSSGILDINDIPMGNVIEISSCGLIDETDNSPSCDQIEEDRGIDHHVSSSNSNTSNRTEGGVVQETEYDTKVNRFDKDISLLPPEDVLRKKTASMILSLNEKEEHQQIYSVTENKLGEIVSAVSDKIEGESCDESDDTLTASEMEISQNGAECISDSEIENVVSKIDGSDLSVLIVSKSSVPLNDRRNSVTSVSTSYVGPKIVSTQLENILSPTDTVKGSPDNVEKDLQLVSHTKHEQIISKSSTLSNTQEVSPLVSSSSIYLASPQCQIPVIPQGEMCWNQYRFLRPSLTPSPFITNLPNLQPRDNNLLLTQFQNYTAAQMACLPAIFPFCQSPFLPQPVYTSPGFLPFPTFTPRTFTASHPCSTSDLTTDQFVNFVRLRQSILGMQDTQVKEQSCHSPDCMKSITSVGHPLHSQPESSALGSNIPVMKTDLAVETAPVNGSSSSVARAACQMMNTDEDPYTKVKETKYYTESSYPLRHPTACVSNTETHFKDVEETNTEMMRKFRKEYTEKYISQNKKFLKASENVDNDRLQEFPISTCESAKSQMDTVTPDPKTQECKSDSFTMKSYAMKKANHLSPSRQYIDLTQDGETQIDSVDGNGDLATVLPPFSTFRLKEAPLSYGSRKNQPVAFQGVRSGREKRSLPEYGLQGKAGNLNSIPVGHVKPFSARK